MKTKRWIRVFLLNILLVILIMSLCSGCRYEPQLEEQGTDSVVFPTDDNLIVVGVSQVGSESVWRTANTNSIQSAFTKEKGYFLLFDNARQKQENQIKAIRSFISQQVDYIVFSPILEDGWDTVLKEARDAGIPVILMDRQVNVEDESLYTAWVGSDFYAEGQKAGQWLEQYLIQLGRQEEDIHIVMLQGTTGATSMIGRTEGFMEIASSHSNWKILEKTDAEYTTAKGKEVMKEMLRSYEQIDVVVSQNDDMTFGAMDAIEEAGLTTGVNGNITLISFDAVKTALQMVKEGKINVDIECNPNQGPFVEKVIRCLEDGTYLANHKYLISVPEQVFDQSNVDEFLDSRTY